MAHSVEVRLPFLQHELVEFLFTLPPHLKIREGWTKWLLRTSMSDKLPQSIAWRKDKTGFEPPQQQWMQHKNVIEAIQEGKRKLVSQRILAPHVMDKKIKPHGAHAVDNRDWKYWSASFLFD
jgi:asparagine synthase (glutamine-hydrolysing)